MNEACGCAICSVGTANTATVEFYLSYRDDMLAITWRYGQIGVDTECALECLLEGAPRVPVKPRGRC